MALTLQSAIDLAREDLNDSDALEANRRYTSVVMLKHANAALLALFNRGPHLWHGKYDDTPSGEHPADFPWPINVQYLRPCADIIVALAETKDDEHVISGRVTAMVERALSMTVA